MVIAGFAGCGKTTFCEKNPGDAIDLVCMPFKYSDFYEVAGSLKEGEKIKANERLMLRENWELYYYWMIRYLLWYSPERQIVIATIRKIMEFLTADYIPYTVVYPERERKEEYEGRYRNRGDSESFLDVFIGRWDDMLDGLEQYGKKQIALQEGQYLSDVVSCMPTDDVYMSRQLVRFAEHLTQETSLAKKLRELREKFPEKAEKGQCAAEETEEYKWQENQSEGIQTDCYDEDKLCAVLYYEPICEEDILDDFVWIESKKELQLLLERAEEKPLYTLKVSVLLMEMVKDKPKYREVVYRKNTENRWNRDV